MHLIHSILNFSKQACILQYVFYIYVVLCTILASLDDFFFYHILSAKTWINFTECNTVCISSLRNLLKFLIMDSNIFFSQVFKYDMLFPIYLSTIFIGYEICILFYTFAKKRTILSFCALVLMNPEFVFHIDLTMQKPAKVISYLCKCM